MKKTLLLFSLTFAGLSFSHFVFGQYNQAKVHWLELGSACLLESGSAYNTTSH